MVDEEFFILKRVFLSQQGFLLCGSRVWNVTVLTLLCEKKMFSHDFRELSVTIEFLHTYLFFLYFFIYKHLI